MTGDSLLIDSIAAAIEDSEDEEEEAIERDNEAYENGEDYDDSEDTGYLLGDGWYRLTKDNHLVMLVGNGCEEPTVIIAATDKNSPTTLSLDVYRAPEDGGYDAEKGGDSIVPNEQGAILLTGYFYVPERKNVTIDFTDFDAGMEKLTNAFTGFYDDEEED